MAGDVVGPGPGEVHRSTVERRTILRAGVVAGSSTLWIAPVVQTIGMGRAFAQGASPPPRTCSPLTGEQLTFSGTSAGSGVNVTCVRDGSSSIIRYSVGCGTYPYGTATGPYPGTFCETGTATVGPEDPVTGEGELLDLTASFTIQQRLYDPLVTPKGPMISISGTKTFVAGTTTGRGTCSRASFPRIIVNASALMYTARIFWPDGFTCDDEGTSRVTIFGDEQSGGGFSEDYTSTRPIP